MTTKNFDVVSHFAKTIVVLALACLMLSALNPSMVAGLLAPTCGAGQYREQGHA
jgi:hypothetical protein